MGRRDEEGRGKRRWRGRGCAFILLLSLLETDTPVRPQKVKLLIIDEVHLLHEDRGAVIESIAARTLRQVESSQSLIRIVGLSATLPNYVDVADFLGVNRYTGLFFFDSSFRPVPLEQHFVGVRGKPGSPQSRTNLDNAAFDKVAELVKGGHQCMVFVHARKETVKTAQMLREKFLAEGLGDLLDPSAGEDTNGKWQGFKRDLASSRNREMKELAAAGFGIHHAGMLRSDRNISERMFEANVTKVRSDESAHRAADTDVAHSARSFAVPLRSPGVSTCPPTPSSSRARKSTTRARVPSST